MSTIEIYMNKTVRSYKEKMMHTNNIKMYKKYSNELKEYLQSIQKQ